MGLVGDVSREEKLTKKIKGCIKEKDQAEAELHLGITFDSLRDSARQNKERKGKKRMGVG
jgi:hypothetical protein